MRKAIWSVVVMLALAFAALLGRNYLLDRHSQSTENNGGSHDPIPPELLARSQETKTELGDVFYRPVKIQVSNSQNLGTVFEDLGKQANIKTVYNGPNQKSEMGLTYDGPFGGALLSLMMTHDLKAQKQPDGSIHVVLR